MSAKSAYRASSAGRSARADAATRANAVARKSAATARTSALDLQRGALLRGARQVQRRAGRAGSDALFDGADVDVLVHELGVQREPLAVEIVPDRLGELAHLRRTAGDGDRARI